MTKNEFPGYIERVLVVLLLFVISIIAIGCRSAEKGKIVNSQGPSGDDTFETNPDYIQNGDGQVVDQPNVGEILPDSDGIEPNKGTPEGATIIVNSVLPFSPEIVEISPEEFIIGIDSEIIVLVSSMPEISAVEFAMAKQVEFERIAADRLVIRPKTSFPGESILRLILADGTIVESFQSVLIRMAKPVIRFFEPETIGTEGGKKLTIGGQELGLGLVVELGSLQIAEIEVIEKGKLIEIVLPEVVQGEYPLALIDSLGNRFVASRAIKVVEGLWRFEVTGMEPNGVILGRTSSIVVHLKNPKPIAKVKIGDVEITDLHFEEDNDMRIIVPDDLKAGDLDLSFTFGDGSTFTFSFPGKIRYPQPKIVSLDPLVVGTSGIGEISIGGNELGDDLEAMIGTTTIFSPRYDPEEETLHIALPSMVAGLYPVKLINGGGEEFLAGEIEATNAGMETSDLTADSDADGMVDFIVNVEPFHRSLGFSPIAFDQEGNDLLCGIIEIESPDGTKLIEIENGALGGLIGRFETQTVILPNNLVDYYGPDDPLQPGSYRFRVYVESEGIARVESTLVRKIDDDISSGNLSLTMYFVGSLYSENDKEELSFIIERIDDLYAQVGISVNQPYDVFFLSGEPFDTLTRITDYTYGEDSPTIRTLLPYATMGEKNAIDVFFVETISTTVSAHEVAGISPLPGSFRKGGKSSGLVIQTEGQALSSLPNKDLEFIGIVMAHELGHFLGLYHTSELDQSGQVPREKLFDPFQDTPECIADPTDPVITDESFCSGFDGGNLLFPISAGTIMTRQQGEVMNLNPYVR